MSHNRKDIDGMEMKKLPIGVEFFEHFKRDNFYYVDKTGFIRDLMNTRGSVNLFTRPRRFGKSLNMDMLKTFFEIGTDPSLFDGLEIAEDDEFCEQYMGRYPVISISLKDVEGMDYQVARAMLGSAVSEEAGRFGFLLGSDRLTKADKKKLNRLIEEDFGEASSLYHSLRLLTQLLFKHYGIPVIVLLDEYDVPLDKAYQNGYYSQMVVLIRSLFSQVLKTNKNLYFAVITGCLRIAKESIFTGLNNFKVRTISDIDCAKYFGFTDHEVREMLRYYGVEDRFADVKKWSKEGWVDVIIPQLYFATGTEETSFNQRLNLWSQHIYENHLLVGYGIYKFGNPDYGSKFQSSDDLKKQFDFAGTKPKVKGSVLYSVKYLVENKVGIMSVIKSVYKNLALLPYLGRIAAEKPNAPTNVRVDGSTLSWSGVQDAYYAVYKNNGADQIATLAGITKETTFRLTEKGIYFVTALNNKNAESNLSDSVTY